MVLLVAEIIVTACGGEASLSRLFPSTPLLPLFQDEKMEEKE
jgi:hypothetical protein